MVIGRDEGVRRRLAAALETAGYRTAAVASSREAKEKLREGIEPCLVVYMMTLDDGGDDYRLAHRADPRTADVPIVLLSVGQPPDDGEPPASMLSALVELIGQYCSRDRARGGAPPAAVH